jgi:hypothetical protein
MQLGTRAGALGPVSPAHSAGAYPGNRYGALLTPISIPYAYQTNGNTGDMSGMGAS